MKCPWIHKCKACDNPDHGYTSCPNKSKSTWNAGRARESFPSFNPCPCLQDKHPASSHYSTSQPGTSSPSDFGHQRPSQSSTRNLFLPGPPPSAQSNSYPCCNNTPISTLGLPRAQSSLEKHAWESYLLDYPDTKFVKSLLHIIDYGASRGFIGPDHSQFCHNLKSAFEAPNAVKSSIQSLFNKCSSSRTILVPSHCQLSCLISWYCNPKKKNQKMTYQSSFLASWWLCQWWCPWLWSSHLLWFLQKCYLPYLLLQTQVSSSQTWSQRCLSSHTSAPVRVFPEDPLLVPFIVLLPLSVSALAY